MSKTSKSTRRLREVTGRTILEHYPGANEYSGPGNPKGTRFQVGPQIIAVRHSYDPNIKFDVDEDGRSALLASASELVISHADIDARSVRITAYSAEQLQKIVEEEHKKRKVSRVILKLPELISEGKLTPLWEDKLPMSVETFGEEGLRDVLAGPALGREVRQEPRSEVDNVSDLMDQLRRALARQHNVRDDDVKIDVSISIRLG